MRNPALQVISSMATRQLLADLVARWSARAGQQVELTSIGGVDAAARVEAGELFDLVVLADAAITSLQAGRHADATALAPIARSGVAACVKAGEPHPAWRNAQDVRHTVLGSRAIGYSTGPSGTALLRLFDSWGIHDTVRHRLVQAKTGVPVASLVVMGDVSLGFQQLSELLHVQGIDILGPLPDDIQIHTTFTGAVCARAPQPGAAADLLRFLASPETADAKHRHGMAPAA